MDADQILAWHASYNAAAAATRAVSAARLDAVMAELGYVPGDGGWVPAPAPPEAAA